MPKEPTAPPGVRIFARLDRFHFECPHCLTLVVSDVDPRRSRQRDILAKRATSRSREAIRTRGRHNRDHPYNPFTQLVTCPTCERTFFAGLLLWSPPQGFRHRPIPPADAVPDRRQLAALREATISKWAVTRKRSGDEVNIFVTEECICSPGCWAVACPVHGDPAQATPIRRGAARPPDPDDPPDSTDR